MSDAPDPAQTAETVAPKVCAFCGAEGDPMRWSAKLGVWFCEDSDPDLDDAAPAHLDGSEGEG